MFQTGTILLGHYRPLDSFLHRLDARSKILPVTLVLILSLLTDSFAFYVVVMAALVLALMYSGVSARTLLNNFKPVLVLVSITLLYHLIFSETESDVLWEIFGWKLTVGAVERAGFYSLRLVLFVSIAFLVTLTNSPSELAEAFAKLLGPLSRLRVPVAEVAMIVFIAIRFIPILFEEFFAIRDAQIMRGVSFSGSLVSRLKKTTFIIIPVFVAAIQRADELALAIEARGYSSGRRRTVYSKARFARSEWLFASAASVFLVLVYYVTL